MQRAQAQGSGVMKKSPFMLITIGGTSMGFSLLGEYQTLKKAMEGARDFINPKYASCNASMEIVDRRAGAIGSSRAYLRHRFLHTEDGSLGKTVGVSSEHEERCIQFIDALVAQRGGT